MDKIISILFSVALILLCVYLLVNSRNEKIIYLTDTLKLSDTVFRKYERVVPKKIYMHKTDTLRIIKEVTGKAEFKKNELTVLTQNEKDSTFKKYEFKNIYRNFALYSDSSGINLYRKDIGWDGIKLKAGLSNINLTDSFKSKLFVGAETGIYYKRLNFNIGINYFPLVRRFGVDAGVSYLIR